MQGQSVHTPKLRKNKGKLNYFSLNFSAFFLRYKGLVAQTQIDLWGMDRPSGG